MMTKFRAIMAIILGHSVMYKMQVFEHKKTKLTKSYEVWPKTKKSFVAYCDFGGTRKQMIPEDKNGA
jgi:hypothetical protein